MSLLETYVFFGVEKEEKIEREREKEGRERERGRKQERATAKKKEEKSRCLTAKSYIVVVADDEFVAGERGDGSEGVFDELRAGSVDY